MPAWMLSLFRVPCSEFRVGEGTLNLEHGTLNGSGARGDIQIRKDAPRNIRVNRVSAVHAGTTVNGFDYTE